MKLDTGRSSLAFEVSRYQLSDIERDALNHYPGIPPLETVKSLREGIMVMQNIVGELYRRGLRMRVLPPRTFRDSLNMGSDSKTAGVYLSGAKLIVIREDELMDGTSVNQKFWVLVHEFAHAIWHLLLEQFERDYITQLFREEKTANPDSMEYRLTNVHEFFADSFRYYVTPHRISGILQVTNKWSRGKKITVEHLLGCSDPSKEDLKRLNVKLFAFLDGKYRGIIDPELVMAKPINQDEEEAYDFWPDAGLYGPVINMGLITTITPIQTKDFEAP